MSGSDDDVRSEPNALTDRAFDGTPTEAVVSTVAEATGASPLEMEPLRQVVDPDALNALVGGGGGECGGGPPVTVSFEYCGRLVTLTADRIGIAPTDARGG